ncbi:50S ribosomal protein L30e [Candidatus Woesearchaeota archaeon]|jgi:large subunit ribosomal protein L30e|nr:50S ribosomal protein L30e [Candidatus Woesearchaeota archaeon]MBT3304740.1 50S ribosomal protein L30e [Candidatus Woesearchaeota archaeon]MBT4367924.1 50S ribosomal protein L30e [Candidatus Woesearchaeota archaeon]MBT4712412.1 50S ribosomal protein L30e [Candidatus Woesearchaeota archaeon]MBT6639324.1 50S ribosomal protein L30e [Candidatus Woesearchaeota archaeon]
MAKKKKAIEENVLKIKKALEEEKVILGTKQVLEGLREGKVKEVYVSTNCPQDVLKDIEQLASISAIGVINLTQANDELGVVCKKPFSISVMAIKNE